MTPSSNPFKLFLLFSFLPLLQAQTFFPCHPSKASPNNDVLCTRVELPPRLCKACPLRPTDSRGGFVDCQRIFDTASNECHDALEQYVNLNECDHVRRDALQGLKNDDQDATAVMDYFLYSLCEQCCDCVPMGTKRTDYIALASAHKPEDPYLWDEARGNCPAHAQFDVCKVLPNIEYFTTPGGDTVDAPKACPLLRDWQNSDAATEWEINPQTDISSPVRTFLRGMLNAIDCDNFSIWNKCHQMEEKQNHLVIRDEFSDFKPDIPDAPNPSDNTDGGDDAEGDNDADMEEMDEDKGDDDDSDDKDDQDKNDQDMNDDNDNDDNDDKEDKDDDEKQPTEDQSSEESDDSDSKTPSDTQSAAIGDDTTEDENENDTNTNTDSDSDSDSDSDTESSVSGTSSTCFPRSSLVELQSGEMVRMDKLRIGDTVRVSEAEFSQVFMFTHRISHPHQEFIELEAGNRTLRVTEGHLVYANDVPVTAEKVRVGDTMRTVGGVVMVSKVGRVMDRGLYNPQTLHGDIVVDGVVVSTYTMAVDRFTATALLAPIRALFGRGLIDERVAGSWFREGYRSIVRV